MTPTSARSGLHGPYSGLSGPGRAEGSTVVRCAAYDRCHGGDFDPAWTSSGPLCPVCLDSAGYDIRALPLDYLDLEQQLPRTSRAGERVSGTRDPSVPLALHVEALQAEIVRVLTTWEEVLREAAQLPELSSGRTRPGWAVQRAATFVAGRLSLLARVGLTTVWAGADEPAIDMTGVQAILVLVELHRKARAVLQLTKKVDALYGECWFPTVVYGDDGCGMPTLRRESGSEIVYCDTCGGKIPWDEYQRGLGLMVLWAQGKRRDSGDMAVSG